VEAIDRTLSVGFFVGYNCRVDRERRLICKAGLALGAVTVLPACGNGATMTEMCGTGALAVGTSADIAVNSALNVPTTEAPLGHSIFVCRDADGYYAFDAGCTHFGCDVSARDTSDLKQGFACACHGATYDANAQNPTSPAPLPLKHYLVCGQASGTLLVDLGVEVDPKVRFKP
jgi:Rieske Fe-S protein